MATLQLSSSMAVASLCSTACSRRTAAVPAKALPALPVTSARSQRPALRRHTIVQAASTEQAGPGPVNAGTVTDATFEELVLNSKTPVLVDFWAPWCGPCRMIAPLIDELADEFGDTLVTLKLNTDESPGIATEYGIRSIPTVMIFKDGQKMDTVIGAVPKATLKSTIEKYVS